MGKTTRYIKIIFDDEQEYCLYADKVIARAATALNETDNEVYKQVLKLGIEQLILQLDNIDDFITARERYMLDLEIKTRERRRRAATIKNALVTLGKDEMLKMATEAGVSIDEDIAHLVYSPTEAKRQWIFDYLADGELHKVEDVTEAAITAGILPERTDAKFGNEHGVFRAEASKMGASSGKYGCWQMIYR